MLQRRQVHKMQYNTTRRAMQLLHFVIRLRAGWFYLAGRIRPADRGLPTTGIKHINKGSQDHCKQRQLSTLCLITPNYVKTNYGPLSHSTFASTITLNLLVTLQTPHHEGKRGTVTW